jgi:hypothetical protein
MEKGSEGRGREGRGGGGKGREGKGEEGMTDVEAEGVGGGDGARGDDDG